MLLFNDLGPALIENSRGVILRDKSGKPDDHTGFFVNCFRTRIKNDYCIHSAFSKAAENPEYGVETAYVLADCNVSREGKMRYLPVYMCTYIQDTVELPILPSI